MPKPPMKADEKMAVKEQILEHAVQIMFREGFDGLSMRKLAAVMDMTAANIYNYFKNKDEIYLGIQKQGFELLNSLFAQVSGLEIPAVEKFRRMARVYVSFGLENVAYYEVMFNRHGPKYSDYKDTPLEPLALAEKMAGLQVFAEAEPVVRELMAHNTELDEKRIWRSLVHAWLLLHGYVALYNSRTLQEVDDCSAEILEEIIHSLTQDSSV